MTLIRPIRLRPKGAVAGTMKYAAPVSALVVGAWAAIGADGAFTQRAHTGANPCTLNKGECYSIQGQSPSAAQCVPPLIPYYVQVESTAIFLECVTGHGND